MSSANCDGSPSLGNVLPGQSRFTVVILYDQLEAGRRAMERLERVRKCAGEELEMATALWRLDVVPEGTTATNAIADIKAADLLLLALEREEEPGPSVRRQLQGFIRQMRPQESALAILTGDGLAKAQSRYAFALATAQAAGVGVVFPSENGQRRETTPLSMSHQRRSIATTPVMAGILANQPARPVWPQE